MQLPVESIANTVVGGAGNIFENVFYGFTVSWGQGEHNASNESWSVFDI